MRNPPSSPADGVAPSTAISARIRPSTDANLYACAEPSTTCTFGWPGTESTTKSRSGVRV